MSLIHIKIDTIFNIRGWKCAFIKS